MIAVRRVASGRLSARTIALYCYGIAPENILTMTYTVAATGDMKRRFMSQFGPEYADRLEFRTINGVSSKIIRYYSEYYRRQAFRLLDNDAELTELVRNIYQSVNMEISNYQLYIKLTPPIPNVVFMPTPEKRKKQARHFHSFIIGEERQVFKV